MGGNEELIRDVPLLAKLERSDLSALAGCGHIRSYSAGGPIFTEGGAGDSLYIIIEGSVRISVLSSEGVEATLALLGPGEFVGDLALLDGRPRSASATAAQPTKVLIVMRDDFRSWLTAHSSASFALLEALAIRVRRTDEALADLAFLDLPRRLAKRLLTLAAESERIKITQAELASMLGVSRESVNKQLNEFARERWIDLGRGSVTVLDAPALRLVL